MHATAPVIGLTSNSTPAVGSAAAYFSVYASYVEAVTRAGGMPVVIPAGLGPGDLSILFERLDGLLLTGGADIAPARFNGRPHPRVYGVDERRDALEIRLAQMAVEQQKPFLGICRGIQVINVALGGSLYTDIADQLPDSLRHDWHPEFPRDHLAHVVALAQGSLLAAILGGEATRVNSMHHQGIERLAADLAASASAPDGLVEGVELPGHPFGAGVQWHPECLPEHAAHRRIFEAFVQAAGVFPT